jgi:DNA-binding MarR family transcriptional regulator
MHFIHRYGTMPAGRLAELTGLTTGAITGVIDRLEKAGYARRTNDPTLTLFYLNNPSLF